MHTLLSWGESASRNTSTLRTLSFIFAWLALSACTTDAPKTTETPYKKTPALSQKNAFEEEVQTIVNQLIEEMKTNDRSHSLRYMESYIASELEKRGMRHARVTIRVEPFIPNNTWEYDYLRIFIGSLYGTTEVALGTKNQADVVPTLINIVENFSLEVRLEVIDTFLRKIEHTEWPLTVEELQNCIHEAISEKDRTFIQHGYKYIETEIGEKNDTGEIEIRLNILDINNNKIIQLPIPTGVIPPREKKQERKKWWGSQYGETMIA